MIVVGILLWCIVMFNSTTLKNRLRRRIVQAGNGKSCIITLVGKNVTRGVRLMAQKGRYRFVASNSSGRVVRYSPDAVLPVQAYPDDAGYDLVYSGNKPLLIAPDEVVTIPSEIAVQWPDGVWGLVIGRSSSFQKGLLTNPTVIDAGYRGTLFAYVRNIRSDWVTVEPGDRIAQIIPMPLLAGAFPMVEVDALDPSERGENGFGSSGR